MINKESKWIALYWYCSLYHRGMGDWRYRYLSSSHYRPSIVGSLSDDLSCDEEAMFYYSKLLNKFENLNIDAVEMVHSLIAAMIHFNETFDFADIDKEDEDDDFVCIPIRLRVFKDCFPKLSYAIHIGDAQYDNDHRGVIVARYFSDDPEEYETIATTMVLSMIDKVLADPNSVVV